MLYRYIPYLEELTELGKELIGELEESTGDSMLKSPRHSHTSESQRAELLVNDQPLSRTRAVLAYVCSITGLCVYWGSSFLTSQEWLPVVTPVSIMITMGLLFYNNLNSEVITFQSCSAEFLEYLCATFLFFLLEVFLDPEYHVVCFSVTTFFVNISTLLVCSMKRKHRRLAVQLGALSSLTLFGNLVINVLRLEVDDDILLGGFLLNKISLKRPFLVRMTVLSTTACFERFFDLKTERICFTSKPLLRCEVSSTAELLRVSRLETVFNSATMKATLATEGFSKKCEILLYNAFS